MGWGTCQKACQSLSLKRDLPVTAECMWPDIKMFDDSGLAKTGALQRSRISPPGELISITWRLLPRIFIFTWMERPQPHIT